ncbi:Imm41 family immunity protein [Pseudomonas sp. MWU16-30322]|uniref:Imm41 family immunity protein n=1 Tax=Pseudomonas sp. MWU16-30322 TaxID=2878092 RepID=UPI001CFBE899|nr:Imm41 family immunity protein [Pseudomonas sp. MWU16-30322]
MDAHSVIARNSSDCEEYDDYSFIGRLHEESIWAHDDYWMLEWALYQLAMGKSPSQELSRRIFRIFSYTFLLLGCHLDRRDSFRIENLKSKEVYDLRERMQLVFEGFFAGRMPATSIFSDPNPLLVSNHQS